MKTIQGFLEHATTNPSPTMAVYPPQPGSANGTGLVIFPGGGYQGLAEHEGKGYAEFFAARGICCFVVTYRLAPGGFRHPAMLEDGLAAMRVVRGRAREFGLQEDRIGVAGSSAGGHLAASVLVHRPRRVHPVSLRPDFGVLCYPVIRMDGPHTNVGSRNNLLGANAALALARSMSCDRRVTAQTPPCFIWHTEEDQAVPVENSLLFAAALRKHGVSFELHVFKTGRHGLGLNTTHPWAECCATWMAAPMVRA